MTVVQAWTESVDIKYGHGRNYILEQLVKSSVKPTLSALNAVLNLSQVLDTNANTFNSALPISPQQKTYIEKLFSNTVIKLSLLFPGQPCFYWKGAKTKKDGGYAKHNPPENLPGSNIVSRYVYQKLVADPGTNDVHHKCGCCACINPAHLQALPPKQNQEIGNPVLTFCQAIWQDAANRKRKGK